MNSRLLAVLAEVSQIEVARMTGLSQSTVSTIKSEKSIEHLCRIVDALGFRLEAKSTPSYPAGYVESVETLADLYRQQRKSKVPA